MLAPGSLSYMSSACMWSWCFIISSSSFNRSTSGHLINCMYCTLKLLPYGLVHHPLPIYSRLSLKRSRHNVNTAKSTCILDPWKKFSCIICKMDHLQQLQSVVHQLPLDSSATLRFEVFFFTSNAKWTENCTL